jgi:hypothetical protein
LVLFRPFLLDGLEAKGSWLGEDLFRVVGTYLGFFVSASFGPLSGGSGILSKGFRGRAARGLAKGTRRTEGWMLGDRIPGVWALVPGVYEHV